MIASILLVVEGPGDKVIWRPVLRQHCPRARFKIHVTHGKQNMLHKPGALVRRAHQQGYELTVFVLDQDRDSSPDQTARSLRTRLRGARPAIIGVAAPNVEAWLLADEKAIRAAFPGSGYRRTGTTDGVTAPLAELSHCVRRHSQGRRSEYRKTRDGPKIADHFDLHRAQHGSRSLRAFVAELRKAQKRPRR